MVRKVAATNFMSYDKVEVYFDDNDRVVNIIGDNGAGKSAFLEIIPFTIFGESRVPFDGLLKHGRDHLVAEVGIDGPSGSVVITRRRKKSEGSSSLELQFLKNGEGPSTHKGKEAVQFIQDHFGMDYFIFSLTSYFGMGSGDSIVTSGTKNRISYLQRIANISIYLELMKRATRAHKLNFDKMKDVDSAIKEMNFLYDSEYEGLDSATEEMVSRIEGLKDTRDSLAKDKGFASTGRDRIYQMTMESKRLEPAIKSLSKSLFDLEGKVEIAQVKLIEMKEEKKMTLRDTFRVRKFLKKYEDGISLVDKKIGSLRSEVDMLSNGVDSFKSEEGCPLCGGDLDEDVIDQWREDIDKLLGLLNKLTSFRDDIRVAVTRQKAISHEYNDAKNNRDHLRLEFKQTKGEIISSKIRLGTIIKEINEFYDKTKLNEIEKELTSVNNQISDLKAAITLNKKKVAKREEWKKRLREHKKLKDQSGLRMDVSDALVEIFSQKGIPLQLLEDICREVEVEATSIFSNFDQGDVLVKRLDDGEGRLDIQFYLDTQSGTHSYNQLSAGQRTLLLLSVRLALSNICFRNHPNTHSLDFIVLDEITTNLSEVKIESLTHVIGKMIDSTFSQVFIISHIPLPNLRSDVSLQATMSIGDSKIEMLE